MIYRVSHRTTYSYTESVALSHNVVRLKTRDSGYQKALTHRLAIEPAPAVTQQTRDYFGNPTTYFTVQDSHTELTVNAFNDVEISPRPIPEPLQTPPWETVRQRLAADRSPEVLEAYQFVFDSLYVPCLPELAEYAGRSFPPGRPFLAAVLDLTARIHAEFKYDVTATTVATPLREVLRQRRGVCQDFAHLEIGCLRSLGLSARYLSGYLLTHPPPGSVRLTGADASHAWLSVWCPGHGWIDLDPTNDLIPSDQHITLAWGRDYDDVSPVKGVLLGGGRQSVAVAVDVVSS